MAKNELQQVTSAAPQQLTAGNVTNITVQNQSADETLKLWATGGTAPASEDDNYALLPPGQILIDVPLAELFPGSTGANRVFAQAERRSAQVFVSHA